MSRALSEGSDFNQFFNTYLPSTTGDSLPRLKARTASFCTERSGHFDAFDSDGRSPLLCPICYAQMRLHITLVPRR